MIDTTNVRIRQVNFIRNICCVNRPKKNIKMTSDVDVNNADLVYLMDEIRSNLSNVSNEHDPMYNVSKAHAWLYTLLALYGEQFQMLVDLYRLFREKNSYGLLSFIIDYLLQHQSNRIDQDRYLQQEFQSISIASSNQ
jgi:hypothetical protein